MRKLLAPSFAFSAFACLPLCATAQPASGPVPEWAQIETIEAEARPGPALWHITRGESDVWILGMVGAMPKGLDWNKQYLADLLDGARAIIMPPRPNLNFLDVGWFIITNCCSLFRLSGGQTLDPLLPETMRAQLAAAREAVDGDAKLYQGDEPLGAAQRLNRDFLKKSGMSYEEPVASINKLARDRKVPQDPAARFDPLPMVKEAIKLGIEQQRVCLGEVIVDVDRMRLHAEAAAQAWAVGDVKGIKAHFAAPRIEDCLARQVKAFGAMEQNRAPDFVAAIEAALAKPGKTIVVLGMGVLLRKNGVLERLEAKGLKIEGPAE